MSQHRSLHVDSVGTKHRNVLKRYERVRKLQDLNKWQERESAFGLPKVKSLKIKVKKVKEVAAAEGAAAPEGIAPAGAPAAKVAVKAPAAKPAAAAPKAKSAEKEKKK